MFEPYAAKAIIEHQFDTDHLNVWITFRFSMNQNVKPSESVWIVDVDGSEKTPASSSWVDAYTLKLVVNSIASAPAVVQVEFDGPDSNLETSWHKNWEPWGYIVSSYVGEANQPLNTTDSPTFAGLTTGDIACKTLEITPVSQTYKITAWSGATNQIAIGNQTTGNNCNINFFAKDGDGTDSLYNIFRGVGTISGGITNTEYGSIGYVGSTTPANRFVVLASGAGGTGTVRPIKIYTGSNTSQMVFNIDGTIRASHRFQSDVGFNVNGDDGISQSIDILDGDGETHHLLTFVGGILTAYSTE